MTQLSKFLGLFVCLFYKEHGVPHVHIYFGRPSRRKGRVIVLRIKDNKVLEEGRDFPRNRIYPAMLWARLHREELLTAWEKCRRGEVPGKIAPLAVAEFSPLARRRKGSTWGVWIRKLVKLGKGRVKAFLGDGRVYVRTGYEHADTARLVQGGVAVKRNRADTIYESAKAFASGPRVRRVK